MTWRQRFKPLIAEVLDQVRGRPEGEVKAALRDAFPAGPREHWPYRVWLDEIRAQRGLKGPPLNWTRKGWQTRQDHPQQVDLFDRVDPEVP